MYDMPLLHRQMLDVLGIQDADKIVPTDNDMKPTDPVSENMNLINGEPVKAFIYQDHEAHIQVHMAAIENPQMQELLSQAPNAGAMQAAMAAHIAEHVAFAYRDKVEKELGVELPPPNEPMPEDIELRLSRLTAPAAAQVTGRAQQEAQAQEQAEMQEDPIVQMQQRELALKEQATMAKAQADMAKIQADLEKSRGKTMVDLQKMEQQERIESAKIAAKMQSQESDEQNKKEIEGFKAGFDLVRDLLDE